MSSEQPGESEGEGRKFDDIASLFGGIVPPAGTPIRRLPVLRPPPPLLDPTAPVSLKPPARLPPKPALANARQRRSPETKNAPAPAPAPSRPIGVVAPPPSPRANAASSTPDPGTPGRPAPRQSTPWPDAFEPQPNFQRQKTAQSWAWVLLVPLIAVLAIGIFMIDPATVRNFVGNHFPHRQRAQLSDLTSPEPSLSRPSSPSQAELNPAQVGQPVPPPPLASQPAISAPLASQSTTETPVSAAMPALLPVQPPSAFGAADARPTPPSTDLSSPAPRPAASVPPPSAPLPPPETAIPTSSTMRIVVVSRHVQGADTEKARVIAQAERVTPHIETRTAASIYRVPTVVYFLPPDREAANTLARSLGGEHPWAVKLGVRRTAPGTLEVWLP